MADINYIDYGTIIGNPVNPFQQSYNDTCAIKSQQLILNEFGIAVTEDQLVEYSAQRGWYNGNGTQMSDVGKLIAEAGIPCTQKSNATKFDLITELSCGHKVIVAVDSDELWDGGLNTWFEDIFTGDTPDHALIVAGIDNTDPKNPMVILTDPGTGQPAQPYPLDQFMDAWKDSGNYMVSTDIPTPSALQSFTANNQPEMHLPEVAGVDYATLQDFANYSHYIDPSMMQDLTTAFHNFPTSGFTDFNAFIADIGMPTYDLTLFPSAEAFFNPICFDYNSLANTEWLNPTNAYTSQSAFDTVEHSIDSLTDLQNDAMDQAQFCIDHGMTASAMIWQSQANDIQSDINNLSGI